MYNKHAVLLSTLLVLTGCVAVNRNAEHDLEALRQALQSKQKDTTNALTDPALLDLHSDTRFRELIRQYAVTGRTTLVTPNEAGESLMIKNKESY
jgi:hypothetical protein